MSPSWCQRLEALRAVLLRAAERQIGPQLRARIAPSDLVQQTFIEAADVLQGRGSVSDEDLANLLRRLLRNNACDAARLANAEKRDVGRELRFRRSTCWQGIRCRDKQPDSAVAQHEADQALDDAIAQLPPVYQRVVFMRHRDRLSFAQIGERLSLSENAAQKTWTRALELLRRQLGKFV